jgi:hypothetical protein
MDYAVGLMGLLQDHAAVADLVDALRGPVGSRPRDPEQIRADLPDEGWLRGILGGAARMNMSCEFEADTNSMTLVSRDPSADGNVGFTATLDVRLAPEGIAETLAGLVNDWLAPMHPYLVSDAGAFRVAYRPPPDLLSTLWMQFANVLSHERPLRVCSFAGCPGPPARPHLFLWRYGSSTGSSRNGTSKYCHPLCASAASAVRRRAGARKTVEPGDQPAEVPAGIIRLDEPETGEMRPVEGRFA